MNCLQLPGQSSQSNQCMPNYAKCKIMQNSESCKVHALCIVFHFAQFCTLNYFQISLAHLWTDFQCCYKKKTSPLSNLQQPIPRHETSVNPCPSQTHSPFPVFGNWILRPISQAFLRRFRRSISSQPIV